MRGERQGMTDSLDNPDPLTLDTKQGENNFTERVRTMSSATSRKPGSGVYMQQYFGHIVYV